MEDNQIIELYWNRSENAILETDKKYGKYCDYIAYNILQNKEDSKECVNDTYLNTWNAIPPQRPNVLKLFLARITRNLAINQYKRKNAKKREQTMEIVLEELQECSSNTSIEQELQYTELVKNINNFLENLSIEKRKIFLERYWYFETIKEICSKNKMSESNVKTTLLRIRQQLKEHLKEDDIYE